MSTERWTDDMLDRLAATVESNSEQIIGLRESIIELRESSREQHESISEQRESIAGQQITVTALLQLAAQTQQKWDQSMALHEESKEKWERFEVLHRESDQRFEVLLAEVRHLIARLDGNEEETAG